MMSARQWCVGMLFYTLYLFLGAAFYYRSESGLERERRYVSRTERIEIFNLLDHFYGSSVVGDVHGFAERLTEYCGLPVTNTTLEDDAADGAYKWNAFNSFLFAITVTTTVGYGNLAPTSDAGRMSMIPYALVGIPFTGILLASLGEFFSVVILRIKARYKRQQRIETRVQLFGDVAAYICAGVLVFILLPACAFVYMEQWSWSLSIYYAFVTISTVGFGDFVAAQQPELGHGPVAFTAYRVALVLWIIFGLGYYFMILAYLTRGMRSKRVLQLEHRLAKNLRDTQARVWHNVTRDVTYLRRAINEAYLQRFTPVYKETSVSVNNRLARSGRSSSLPDLSTTSHAGSSLVQSRSESDLSRVDRQATFEAPGTEMTQLALLGHVVDALAGAQCGLSETDILASERMFQDQGHTTRVALEPQLMTWTANTTRKSSNPSRQRRNTWFHPSAATESVTSSRSRSLLERWQRQRLKARSVGSLLANGDVEQGDAVDADADSDADVDPNADADAEVGSLLEETSVGEFLRALAAVHSRVPTMHGGTTSPATSLANLFGQSGDRRRFSVRPATLSDDAPQRRRCSVLPSSPRRIVSQERRFSALPTTVTFDALHDRRFSAVPSPLVGHERRFSASPALPAAGPRRSSLRGGNRFPREQPLRPRFRLGPEDAMARPRAAEVPARSRHTSS